uniref:Pept_C1 domain-containing protein n=1 Tax=Heterorhabditis bacteriophora TaxID=37862 RepID=A0A1I7X4F1_HETBA
MTALLPFWAIICATAICSVTEDLKEEMIVVLTLKKLVVMFLNILMPTSKVFMSLLIFSLRLRRYYLSRRRFYIHQLSNLHYSICIDKLWKCDQTTCMIQDDLLQKVQHGRFSWIARNYSFFWGRSLDEGIKYRLGTLFPEQSVQNMNEIVIKPRELPQEFDAREKYVFAHRQPLCPRSSYRFCPPAIPVITSENGIVSFLLVHYSLVILNKMLWPAHIHEVRDQGDCGSSWAVSTTTISADRLAIITDGRINVTLSPQQLLSCNQHRQRGCEGGYLDRAWWYIRKLGVVSEECYPYESGQTREPGICRIPKSSYKMVNRLTCPADIKLSSAVYKMTPPYRVASREEDIMTEIITNGPVQATFVVHEDFFMYSGGIYQHSDLAAEKGARFTGQGYHSVRILGYVSRNIRINCKHQSILFLQRLAHSLASLSIPEVQNDPAINCRDQVETLRMGSQTMPPLLVNGLGDSPQQAPPSPVPSERHELPATIQPSLQEQEEIPLEAGCPSVAELPLSSVQDPHITQLNNFAPIPSSIPSFPQANLPPTTTVVHQEHMPPQPPQHFPSPTQQFNHPPQQGFIPPQQCVPPSQQFGPSSQQPFASQIVSPVQPPTPQSSVSSAPLTQSTQQGFASLHQPGFAPPPQQGQGFVSPPQQGQGFAPPPQQGQGFAPSSQQGFAPPPVIPSQFAPPQQGFAPLPPQNFPPSSGFGQHQLAGHIPPSEPAPPSGAPQQFTPPPSMIPGGFAPPPRGGPTGAPGGNPFARGPGGPGYRSSSYHN